MRRLRRRGRRRLFLFALGLLAGRVRLCQATIGAVEVVELRLGRGRYQQQGQQGRGNHDRTPTHGRDHSAKTRRLRIALCAFGALTLAACSPQDVLRPGFLGRKIDIPPAQPKVVVGGPSGALLQGGVAPVVPDGMADAAVAPALREWLTPAERASLAAASQHAAVAVTGTAVTWQSKDGRGNATAGGTVMPTGEAYRSLRGPLCRDLRQSVKKGGEPHVQQVTLCRTDDGQGLYLWLIAQPE
jgi:surface antigen